MRYLILIRHSVPDIQPDLPANQWRLSAKGIERCAWLARQIDFFHPDRLISSEETKAIETAKILAEKLAIPMEKSPGLQEHARTTVPYTSHADFEAKVAIFFNQSADLVFGEETAAQALDRISVTIHTILDRHPGETLALITHGTVMALFVTAHNKMIAFDYWKSLSLPAFTILDATTKKLVETRTYPSPAIT